MAGTGINELLRVPLSLDVWERKGEVLVVAAEEEQLVGIGAASTGTGGTDLHDRGSGPPYSED